LSRSSCDQDLLLVFANQSCEESGSVEVKLMLLLELP
jgi:hypothetical protein